MAIPRKGTRKYERWIESPNGITWKENVAKANHKKAKDPEWNKKLSEALHKKYDKDPEYKKNVIDATRLRYKNPIYRKKQTDVLNKLHKDPDFQKRRREMHESQEYRDKIANTLRMKYRDDLDYREIHAKAGRKRSEDPIWRKNQAVGAYKNRIDGILRGPYCEMWTPLLRQRVREFWDNTCQLCGKIQKENGKKLDVHHVTFDKLACCHLENAKKLFKLSMEERDAFLSDMNNGSLRILLERFKLTEKKVAQIEQERILDNEIMDRYNIPDEYRWMFIPLCRSCHTKTNAKNKRNHYKLYFIEYIMKETRGKSYYTSEEWNQQNRLGDMNQLAIV